MSDRSRRWGVVLPISAILLLAAALRLWGIDFGLPYIYHTDEWFEVKRALKLGEGVFDLERVGKGGYYYLLFVLYGAFYVFSRITGAVAGTSEFLLALFRDPTPFWLIGRCTTAIIGVLNCFLLYRLATLWVSRLAGLAAATFMAVHTLHVASSHYITVDVPMTALLTGCLLVMHRKKPASWGRYLGLALLAAMTVVTKISAAPIMLSILVFHYGELRAPWRLGTALAHLVDRRLLLFGVTFVGTYVALEPGVLLKGANLVQWFFSFVNPSAEQYTPDAYPVLDAPASIVGLYFGWMFPWRYTVVLLLFCGGLLASLRRVSPWRQLGLVFAVPYVYFIVSINRPDQIFARYLLPLTPVIWMYVGLSVHEIHDWARRRWRLAAPFCFLIVVLAAAPLLSDSLAEGVERSRPDTRTQAKMWIEEHIPAGSVIYISGSMVRASALTAPLNIEPDVVDEIVLGFSDTESLEPGRPKSRFYETFKRALREKKTYRLVLSDNRDQMARALDQSLGDYVVLIEGVRRLYTIPRNRENFPERYRLIRWVDSADFRLLRRFEATDDKTGPTLMVYERVRSSGQTGEPPQGEE